MKEVIIRYIDLPCHVRGYVKEDANCDYNIYINSRLSYDMQQVTIKHELNHIINNDFCSDMPISEIEQSACVC